MVFNDGTSSALDGENASNLQDNIYETLSFKKGNESNSGIRTLGCCPAPNLASKFYADNIGALQLPRNVRHDVNSISAANTTSNHTQTTRVRRMRVSTDHK